MNDAFRAVNRLLAAGEEVRRLRGAVRGQRHDLPGGHVLRRPQADDAAALEKLAAELGTPFTGCPAAPGEEAVAAQAGARRAVGPLRRVDAVRLDAAAAGAVRVPVQGGLRARSWTRATCARSTTC